jgi:hypothetical protein
MLALERCVRRMISGNRGAICPQGPHLIATSSIERCGVAAVKGIDRASPREAQQRKLGFFLEPIALANLGNRLRHIEHCSDPLLAN